jgi:hypothetical protein
MGLDPLDFSSDYGRVFVVVPVGPSMKLLLIKSTLLTLYSSFSVSDFTSHVPHSP